LFWSSQPEHIVAIASDEPIAVPVPRLALDDHEAILQFICNYLDLK
jgi:hypothetical protein